MGQWAGRWRSLLAVSDDEERRRNQGRAFQRSGRMVGVRLEAGRVSARVQGSRATPYQVELLLPVLEEHVWATLTELIAGQVRHGARLLAGEAPVGLEDEVRALAGVDLFPALPEVEARCACGETGRRCSHVFALWEEIAERIDADPFVLLVMRGRGRERLLREVSLLRRRLRGGQEPQPAVRLDAVDPGRWAAAADDLAQMRVPVHEPPATPAGPLRLLGDPPGWAGGVGAWELFGPLVEQAAARATALVAGVQGPQGSQEVQERPEPA